MRAEYPLALFDLDGTLTDSGAGITGSVRRTLLRMKRPVPPPDVLRRFVGPPAWQSFQQLCAMSPAEADEGIRIFREIYGESGAFDSRVYDGIPALLDSLRRAGAKLAVATSKPRSMAMKVLRHFNLLRRFDTVSAAPEDDHGVGKEELIRPVLAKLKVPAARAVMIGDTRFDAAGARKAGVNFIGVLYGFGTEEELRRAGGRVFARSVEELSSLLIDKSRTMR